MRVVLIILLLFLTGCSSKNTVDISDLETTEQPFDEWIDQDFSPIDPLTEYSYVDEYPWTNWNYFWFSSAILGQGADVVSTERALDRGCVEANPFFGSDPSTGLLIGVKALALGGTYYYIEEHYQGDKQTMRNIAYSMFGIAGFGLAIYNENVDCY